MPSLLRRTAFCSAAEAAGLTAGAGAARSVDAMADRSGLAGSAWDGLVEGTAVGLAQAWPLGRWLPGLRRRCYVVATVLVAGLGLVMGAVLVAAGDGVDLPGCKQPGANWAIGWVLLDGALTGVFAGAALGLVSWRLLPSLVGAPRAVGESRLRFGG